VSRKRPRAPSPFQAPLQRLTDDKTTVTIKGETKAVSDLKVGDKVRITLGEDGKTATAIISGKAPKPAEAPTTQG